LSDRGKASKLFKPTWWNFDLFKETRLFILNLDEAALKPAVTSAAERQRKLDAENEETTLQVKEKRAIDKLEQEGKIELSKKLCTGFDELSKTNTSISSSLEKIVSKLDWNSPGDYESMSSGNDTRLTKVEEKVSDMSGKIDQILALLSKKN
jgi:hypothetical protein